MIFSIRIVFEYDEKGHLIMKSLLSGLTVEYDYNWAGNLAGI